MKFIPNFLKFLKNFNYSERFRKVQRIKMVFLRFLGSVFFLAPLELCSKGMASGRESIRKFALKSRKKRSAQRPFLPKTYLLRRFQGSSWRLVPCPCVLVVSLLVTRVNPYPKTKKFWNTIKDESIPTVLTWHGAMQTPKSLSQHQAEGRCCHYAIQSTLSTRKKLFFGFTIYISG